MKNKFEFTYINLEKYYEQAISSGYKVITCEQYALNKEISVPTIVNRVDIDFSVKKAERLVDIYKKMDLKATFFIRLHANEYNPFSLKTTELLEELLMKVTKLDTTLKS